MIPAGAPAFHPGRTAEREVDIERSGGAMRLARHSLRHLQRVGITGGIDTGDPEVAAKLMPFVYEELRRLAGNYLQHASAPAPLI
jgi:hypothetical protein